MLRNLIAIYLIFITQFTYGITNPEKDWRYLQKGPVVLACHEQDMDTGEAVLGMLMQAVPRISRDLNLAQIDRIMVIIAPSEKAFQNMTSRSIPDWGVGAANPSSGTIFLKSPRFARPETDMELVVIHELAHVLLGIALEGQPVDRWFDEGFAVYQSGEESMSSKIIFARSLVTNNPIRLEQVDAVLTFHRDKAGLAYQESHAAVAYLIQEYGSETISRIIGRMRLGEDMDQALQNTIGLNLDDFEHLWLKAMKKKYQWYVLFDFPVLFSALLVSFFIAAWIMTRKRIKKRKQMWDEEETKETLQKMAENPISD